MFPIKKEGSEIYSIAMLIYYLLVGKDPYENNLQTLSKEELLKEVLENHRRPTIPWEFEYNYPIITQTLRDYWGARLYSFEEMREKFAKLSASN